MGDLFRLICCTVVGLFRSRAALQAEILVLRHQLNVLRRKSPKAALFFAAPKGVKLAEMRNGSRQAGALEKALRDAVDRRRPDFVMLDPLQEGRHWQVEGKIERADETTTAVEITAQDASGNALTGLTASQLASILVDAICEHCAAIFVAGCHGSISRDS
jgi:hypothetical protein